MKTMKYGIALFALALCLALGTQQAHAQFSLGAHAGYNLDVISEDGAEEGAAFVGGEARFGLGQYPVVINPSASYFLTGLENTSTLEFDLNALYEFGYNNTSFTPYAGVGLGVTRVAFDSDIPLVGNNFEDSETDYGLNLIGGARFGFGQIQPFVQARITFGEHLSFVNDDGQGGSGYALMGGVLFRLGQ